MHKLERSLDLPAVIAFAVGAMLGGEIFVLPAIAAGVTGPSMWLAFVAAAVLVLPAALSQSELATAIPGSGGSYLYIERCLGPVAGTIAGLGLWLSLMLKCAFAMVVLITYLRLILDVPGQLVAIALVAGLTGLNVLGVRKVGRFQSMIVLACVLCLTGLVLVGVAQVSAHDQGSLSKVFGPDPFLSAGPAGFLSAVGLVFVSYAGVTKVAAIAEEVKNESRNIPLGILLSLVFMCILYASVSWVLVWTYDVAALAVDQAPIASLANHLLGEYGEVVINIAAVVALISMANAGLLAASRFPFAMSRDRLIPSIFGTINTRFVSPVTSVIVTGLAIVLALSFLDVVRIVKLASVFMIAAFMAVNASLLILRESGVQWYKPRFRSPLYPYIQIMGLLTGFALLWAVGSVTLEGIGAATAVGGLVYLGYGRRHAPRNGVLRQLMGRSDIIADAPTPPPTERAEVPAAHTVVPLFGSEASPEALVHLGATLAERHDMEVLKISDLPDQTILDEDLVEGDRISSLQRRVLGLADERRVPIRFHSLVSRDMRKTLYEYANRTNSLWFVMSWREPGLIIRDPYQWLYTHLPCNVALFKDAGIRTYRQLLAVLEPGPHDALIVRTVDQLASLYRARVTLARVLPMNATADERAQSSEYLSQMQRLCREATSTEVIATDDWVPQLSKASARFDMLVFGAPPDRPFRATFLRSKEDRLMEEAHCAVVRLKTPQKEMHRAVSTAPRHDGVGDIASLLDATAARAKLEITRKDQLFTVISETFAQISPAPVVAISMAFEAREQQQNTAMGDGVAMPHGTLPGLDCTRMVLVTLARPISYSSSGVKVEVCIATLGPPTDRETHLRLIAGMSRLILKTDLLAWLRAAPDANALLAAVRKAVAQLADRTETGATRREGDGA
ncbi:MAG: amino acid permease [Nannocystaceae bacterium]